MSKHNTTHKEPVAVWRFKLGIIILVFGLFGPPALMPIVLSMDLSAAKMASITGAIVVVCDLAILASAAVMGKDGYAFVKARFIGYWRLYGPPQSVSKARYYTGLVMVCLSVLMGWITPYASIWLSGYAGNEVRIAIAGDLLLLAGLFVLGGDFWDKLRALIKHDAKAQFRPA